MQDGSNALQFDGASLSAEPGMPIELALRVRSYLCQIVGRSVPITYQALAKAMDLSPPNTIHQITVVLECLIEEDAAADRPLLASFVVSKARGGLPAPGFFECARRVGRFQGDLSGPEASSFYTAEFANAVDFWGGTTDIMGQVLKPDSS